MQHQAHKSIRQSPIPKYSFTHPNCDNQHPSGLLPKPTNLTLYSVRHLFQHRISSSDTTIKPPPTMTSAQETAYNPEITSSVHKSSSVRFFAKWATVDRNWSRTDPDIVGTEPDHLGPVFCHPWN